MKTVVTGLLLVGPLLLSGHATAGQVEDLTARMDALQRENSAIRKENAALRENKRLWERNAGLQPSAPAVRSTAASLKPGVYNAMAADLPVAYKALPPPEDPGRLQIWAEGGAIWSGGDPVTRTGNLSSIPGLGVLVGSTPYIFDLTPKVGWEAATGFDYRLANSPWHISGQFRYGEGGKTSGSASVAGTLDPALVALLAPAGSTVGGSQAFAASYKETHWLADLAVGREIAGSGRGALQLKGGLRVAEFVTQANTSDSSNVFANFPAPFPILGAGSPAVSAFSTTTNTLTNTRASFLGAGPLIGVQGSVPFAGNWSFDYLGDAAILFGSQQSNSVVTTGTVVTPAFLGAFVGNGGGVTTTTAERFAYVLSADIQVGVSYWFTPNLKVGASYRLDALINVQNQSGPAVANIMPDRYTHGPRLTVTSQF